MQIRYDNLPTPPGWSRDKIGNRLKLNYGKSQAAIKADDGTIPIYGTGGLMGYGHQALCDGDSVLIGRKGTLGNPQYFDHPFWPVDTTYYTSDFDGSMKWFYYLIQTVGLSSLNEATGVPSLSRQTFYNLEVLFPSPAEQTAIADILATVDRAIEQTEALIAKQRRIKAGLLHDLLTRGIDEHGHLRDPSTHRFKPSPVGLVPEEWEVGTLDDLARNLDSHRVPLKQSVREKKHGDYPYYGASGIIDWIDGYIFDGEFVLLGEDGENVVSRNLPLAFRASGKIWVNNHAHVLEPLAGTDVRFLEELLEHTNYDDIVAGSAQPKITQTGLTRLRFPLPPTHEQRRIGEILSGQKQHLQGHLNSVIKLRRLKAGLMQDLLSGRVSVAGLAQAGGQPQ